MTHGRVSRAVARLLRPFHRHQSKDDEAPTKRQRGSMTSTTTSSTCSTTSSRSSAGGFRGSSGARAFTFKTDGDGIPHTVMMPPALVRQLRALTEQAAALSSGEQLRASHKGFEPSLSTSRSTLRWRGDFSTKTLDKLLIILTEDDTDGFASSIGRRSAKPVPLDTAAKAMLQLWTDCMQILDVLADGAVPEPSLRHTVAHSRDLAIAAAAEKRRQLEQAALTLLALVIRRQEFDALLVAVGHGGCKSHKPADEARHGKGRLSKRLSRTSRRSRSVSTTANSGNRSSLSAKPTRQSKKGKRAGQDRNARLCDLVHRFLELHQSTLHYAFETVHGSIDASDSNAEFSSFDPHQELLSALVATSYVRVPRLRSHMLDSLSNLTPATSFTSSRSVSLTFLSSRTRGKSFLDDKLRLTPYNWHLSMYPQCQNLLTTVNREDRWASSVQMLHQLMSDTDGCMLVLAQIFKQLTGQQVLGRTDWKNIPGADILKDATLEITKSLFQTELQQREPKWQDSVEEKVGNDTASASEKEPQPFRDSFSLMDGSLEEIDTPTAYFAVQVTSMMHENVGFIHEYLMTILRATNYMVPHHVTLCLQYMEKLMLEFPAFFVNEAPAQDFLALSTMDTANPRNQPQQEHSCADVDTLRYVFSCLLESEHFEILKATELFLLKNFMGLSVSLQLQLTDLLATHLKRLFLHWNRDVRYCFYHVLLYLTYPGNRLVLGARSDEALMGAEASRLFEIPGLVRSGGSASWDAFDVPLQQIVARYTQMTKRRPRARHATSWVDAVPWTIVQRSVTEYKTHVKTYFAYAQQISMHQRVPTPVFSVKNGEDAPSPAAADRPRQAAVLA
ncbi:hypothetical protein PR003_g1711 [Phytophthora rubi]|uniref:Uncharacterized protein n=1 Tax=Phytophthora rubi TaxID=129364 RepID=A0A6A3NU05_9STRA|nr:hypothetical protein PR002_g1478 [Phytophthora rubi]KAE9049290.1 hypothetical protein PR001_g3461 [Phytophthora rubi]KAE9357589.1 hypothetical protein PR003_g1711 [Phytophthora rubi]